MIDWGQVCLGYFDPFGDRFIWIVLTRSGTVPKRIISIDWGQSPNGTKWSIGDCPQSIALSPNRSIARVFTHKSRVP